MSQKPNIVQITTHDSGRHFGCYGHPTLHTPAIDSLAAGGVRFTNYFCTVPICSASRVSQLTGLYPQSNGMMDLVNFGWRIRDGVRHASRIFKAAGYRTALFGVQHEVLGSDLGRLEFDLAEPKPANALAVAGRVAAFLKESSQPQQPFYAQVGFRETHTPFDRDGARPDSKRGVEIPPYMDDTLSSRTAMAGYQGAIRVVDSAVAMILAALRAGGLENDTIVVFTTDHGIEMPRAKWNLYDPGIAIGMIVRYPRGSLAGGRECSLLMSNVDYLPTLLELAGVSCRGTMEGHSFAGALHRELPGPVRSEVFGLYHKTQTRCVRTNRFKLIRHFDNATDYHTIPVRTEDAQMKRVIGQVELFDLKADPNEFNNLAGRPEHLSEQLALENSLWKWMEAVDDPLLKGPVRTPSYNAAISDYKSWKKGKHSSRLRRAARRRQDRGAGRK
ncbi:MAG: sulfatase [Kiritimatiellia bacterium]